MDLLIVEWSLEHAFKFSMHNLIKEITVNFPDIQRSFTSKPFVYYATCLKLISKDDVPKFSEIKIFYAALRRLKDNYPNICRVSTKLMKLLWFLEWLKEFHSILNNEVTGVSKGKINKLRACMEDLEKEFADTWKNNPQNQPEGLLEMKVLLSNEFTYTDEICFKLISRMTKFVYPLFETCKESIKSHLPLSGIERLKKSSLQNCVLTEDSQLLLNSRNRYFYFSDMIKSDSSEKGLLLVVNLIKKIPCEDIAFKTVRHPQTTSSSLVDLYRCKNSENKQEIGLECNRRVNEEIQPLLKRKKLYHGKEYIENKFEISSRKHVSTNKEVFEEPFNKDVYEETGKEEENVVSMEQCGSRVGSDRGKECQISGSNYSNQLLLNESPKSNNIMKIYSKTDMKTAKDSWKVSCKVSKISEKDAYITKQLPPEDIAHETAEYCKITSGSTVDINICETLKNKQNKGFECNKHFDSEKQILLKREILNHFKDNIEKSSNSREYKVSTNGKVSEEKECKIPESDCLYQILLNKSQKSNNLEINCNTDKRTAKNSRKVFRKFSEILVEDAFCICNTVGLTQTRHEFNSLIKIYNLTFEKNHLNKPKITETDCLSSQEKLVETPSVDKFERNNLNTDYEDGIIFTQEEDSERLPYELGSGINMMPVTKVNEKFFNDFHI